MRAPGRPSLVHRGSLVVAGASLALVLALAYRYGTAHGSVAPATTGRELVALLLALLAFVLSLAVLVFRPERGEAGRLIRTAVAWSVALLVALGCVWYLIDAAAPTGLGLGTPLLDQADVDAYLADHLASAPATGAERPLPVPTGVLLQALSFPTTDSVKVDGYVWQRYPPTVPADVARGFILPEAEAEGYQATEVFRFAEGDGTETVGWHVTAILPQAFDYRRYPFDRQNVALRLWHRDLDPRVVLVPDLAAYRDLAPAALPGLSPRLVSGGWQPVSADFRYAGSGDDVGVSIGARIGAAAVPQLSFNVGLKRFFLGPFFDHVAFAAVVALLLFAVLCLTAKEEATKSRLGISTFGVLGSCTGLLFTVILKHNELRDAIAPGQLAYLEVLTFLINLAIILVALNAILLASPLRIRFIEYENNLLPDLLYWPVLLGLLLAVTLLVFFR